MDQAFKDRILNGLKAIYALRRSPWHGTPVAFEMKPDGIYADVTEQGGLNEEKMAQFSFRTAATGSWCNWSSADSIKMFGQRYTLDGAPLS